MSGTNAVPRLDIGSELRRLRQQAGMSLTDLAKRVHFSRAHLSKIENGRVRASMELVRRCDAAVGAEGRLIAAAERHAVMSVPEDAGEGTEDVWVMGVGADGAGWATPVNRRDALRAGVSSWVSLRLTPPTPRPAALGPALEGFSALFREVRRLGQVTGPGVVLPMVIAQTQAVRGVAAAAGESPERTALLRLAARFAEFAGWMAQEAGDDRIAAGWTREAVEIAGAAGDRELEAHAWVRRALITLYRDDHQQTVELARRGQSDPRVSPRIRGLAALREAQGHALGGDHDACRRALDRGRELLAEAGGGGAQPPADVPALGPASVPDMAAVVTGWCLYDLGRPAAAVEVLGPVFDRMPVTSRRARARYGARLALAYLGVGEVDQACGLLDRLLDDTDAVDSATIRHDLRRFSRFLPQWRSYSGAQELHARLSAQLRMPVP